MIERKARLRAIRDNGKLRLFLLTTTAEKLQRGEP